MDKVTIRKNMKELFNKLNKTDIAFNSMAITKKIKDLNVFKDAESVFIFSSISFEPNTEELIKYCLQQGKKVYLPTIVFNEIYPVRIDENSKYYAGKYNIKEPFGDIYFGDIDLTILPLTAFDNNLNRVGKGGGYYDKFLAGKDTYKLGVGYSFMKVDSIDDAEDFDIKLDCVVTEEGVHYANN